MLYKLLYHTLVQLAVEDLVLLKQLSKKSVKLTYLVSKQFFVVA
jgi:hypothetical protein